MPKDLKLHGMRVPRKGECDVGVLGHTHAMQFKVFGHSPSQWIYDEWGGHYQEGGQHLIVSTGAGSNIPFRFGAWPEVVEIELTR